MDHEAYLDRIGYRGSREPTPRTLRDLQLAHLRTVPFENLSIHAAEPIVLTDNALFDKIVVRRRGGFCYELNGLFAALLRALGYDVSMLSAEVADGKGGYTPEFDHMTLRVRLEEKWLVDVGFGDSFREPLLLDERGTQTQLGGSYRIATAGDHRLLEARKTNEDWKPSYRFTLQEFRYADFEPRCDFHRTSPDSHFQRSRVCSRATADGRLTLSDRRWIETSSSGERKERVATSDEEVSRWLSEGFGIEDPA